MKFCQYCGTKVEDGQQCTCPAAQQVAARRAAAARQAAQQPDVAAQQPTAQPAAAAQQPTVRPAAIPPKQHAVVPKAVLNQGQKEEMQKAMAQAGDSAKAAGKAAWSSAKSLAGSAQGALSNSAGAQGAALYRMAMMFFGALHVLFFFILSYAKLDDRGNLVKSVAQMLGIDVPRRLTGLTLIRLMDGCADWGVRNADTAYIEFLILFGLPVLFGVLLIALNCVKKSGGMIGSVVLSALTLVCYLLAYPDMSANAKNLGYEMGIGFVFVVIVVILQIVAAVMGHIAGRKARKAGKMDPRTLQAAVPAPALHVSAAPVSQTPQTAPVPAAPVSAEYTPAPSVPAVSVPQASPAPSRSLLCRNCGARVLGNSRFCGSCGAPVAPDPNEYRQ